MAASGPTASGDPFAPRSVAGRLPIPGAATFTEKKGGIVLDWPLSVFLNPLSPGRGRQPHPHMERLFELAAATMGHRLTKQIDSGGRLYLCGCEVWDYYVSDDGPNPGDEADHANPGDLIDHIERDAWPEHVINAEYTRARHDG